MGSDMDYIQNNQSSPRSLKTHMTISLYADSGEHRQCNGPLSSHQIVIKQQRTLNDKDTKCMVKLGIMESFKGWWGGLHSHCNVVTLVTEHTKKEV